MAQEQLNGAQVGARFEQVNRKGMAQRVRADGLGDAGPNARCAAGMLNGVRGNWSAEIPGEQPLPLAARSASSRATCRAVSARA